MLVPHPGEIRSKWGKTINKGRKPKDYRIALDSEGNAIVSETVWKRLQEAGSSFIVLNEVKDPPPQILSHQDETVYTPATYIEIDKAVRELLPPGVTRFTVRKHNG